MFEWCSISVRSTRSPGLMYVRATRFMAPLAFGVKMVSATPAPIQSATFRRAPSKSSVERPASG
jgi:hypothetical protein